MVKNIQQAGFTLFETLIALTIMMAVLATGSSYLKYSADNDMNRTAAAGLQQLTHAVQSYAKDHFGTLVMGGESTVDLDVLKQQNYLGETFSAINSFGQIYKVTFVPDTTGSKSALQIRVITQNGDAINLSGMRKIAALTGNDAGYAVTAGSITGHQEGWTLPATINAGHLATVSYVAGQDVISSETFLRRDKVDGHPEWNQMNTDLGIGDNTITFEKGQIVFHDNSLDANFSADKLAFEKDKTTTEIKAEGVSVDEGTGVKTQVNAGKIALEGGNNDSSTTLTNAWIKPPTYLISSTNLRDIYAKADDSCGGAGIEHTGKMFTVGSSSDKGRFLFMCGEKDGFELGTKTGRAYLIASSFRGVMAGIEQTNTCNDWNPVKGKDTCVGNGASDRRAYTIKYLDYVRDIEAKHYWRSGGCRVDTPGSTTEHSAVCSVKTSTIFLDGITTSTFDPQSYAHKYCTGSGIGSWGGDLQNIYVLPEGRENENPDQCQFLKYHD